MIPKTIHYCWFGGKELSPMAKSCIAGWQKYLPDYRIKEWNERNFDIHCCRYVEEAYQAKKWAFVSDVARLYALSQEGGIYMDTDMEVLRPLDCFLDAPMFMGFEVKDSVSTAIIGAEQGALPVKAWLEAYKEASFVRDDGSFDQTTNVMRITDDLLRRGLQPNGKRQRVQDVELYPEIVFSPNNLSRIWGKSSDKSCTIHHFDGSWIDGQDSTPSMKLRIRRYLVGVLRNTIGTAKVAAMKK